MTKNNGATQPPLVGREPSAALTEGMQGLRHDSVGDAMMAHLVRHGSAVEEVCASRHIHYWWDTGQAVRYAADDVINPSTEDFCGELLKRRRRSMSRVVTGVRKAFDPEPWPRITAPRERTTDKRLPPCSTNVP